jgi:hypothetical protein
MEPGVTQQPPVNLGRLVSAIVIEHQMHFEMSGHLLVDTD